MFWFGVGIAAGVAVTRKVNETARKATPTGMAEQVGGALSDLADAVGSFGADVRAGMQEREREIDELVDKLMIARATTRDGEPVKFGNDPATMPGPENTYQSYGTAG